MQHNIHGINWQHNLQDMISSTYKHKYINAILDICYDYLYWWSYLIYSTKDTSKFTLQILSQTLAKTSFFTATLWSKKSINNIFCSQNIIFPCWSNLNIYIKAHCKLVSMTLYYTKGPWWPWYAHLSYNISINKWRLYEQK